MNKNKPYLNSDNRIVTRIPLIELWNEAGLLKLQKRQYLDENAVKGLITTEDIQFVVADISQPLKWIDKKAKFDFWEDELAVHLCGETSEGCYLEDFQDKYFYFASLWISDTEKVILAEKYH